MDNGIGTNRRLDFQSYCLVEAVALYFFDGEKGTNYCFIVSTLSINFVSEVFSAGRQGYANLILSICTIQYLVLIPHIIPLKSIYCYFRLFILLVGQLFFYILNIIKHLPQTYIRGIKFLSVNTDICIVSINLCRREVIGCLSMSFGILPGPLVCL